MIKRYQVNSNEDDKVVQEKEINKIGETENKNNMNSYDEEMEPLPPKPCGLKIEINHEEAVLNEALQNLTPRWKNWAIRTIYTLVMLIGFIYIIYLGPLPLTILIMIIIMKCCLEVINIGLVAFKAENLPGLKKVGVIFLLAHNYYLYGESFITKFGNEIQNEMLLKPFIYYHRFVKMNIINE